MSRTDLENAHVLFLLPMRGFRGLATIHGPVNWACHVVVESGGYVYDPDYRVPAVGVELRRYLREMFGGPETNSHFNFFYSLLPIPAASYLARYRVFHPVKLPESRFGHLQEQAFMKPYFTRAVRGSYSFADVDRAGTWVGQALRPIR